METAIDKKGQEVVSKNLQDFDSRFAKFLIYHSFALVCAWASLGGLMDLLMYAVGNQVLRTPNAAGAAVLLFGGLSIYLFKKSRSLYDLMMLGVGILFTTSVKYERIKNNEKFNKRSDDSSVDSSKRRQCHL